MNSIVVARWGRHGNRSEGMGTIPKRFIKPPILDLL
jgi:hypothetical protein